MAGFELAKLYGAAGTSDSTLASLGRSASMGQQGAMVVAQRRRKKQLEQALSTGRLNLAQLGAADASLLKPPSAQRIGGSQGVGGPIGAVGGFLGNLGSDIWTATKYAGPGLYQLGKGAVQDVVSKPISLLNPLSLVGAPITAAIERGPKSETYQHTIKPTVQGYGQYYGHDLGKHLYEHPLQPILDVATVLSGGASAAARLGGLGVRIAEPGSALAKLGEAGVSLTSRGGRAPLVHPVTGAELPREFTPRPISKAAQRGLDQLARIPAPGPLKNVISEWQLGQEIRRTSRRDLAQMQAQRWDVTGEALEDVKDIAALNDKEAFAMTLAHQGVNTPAKLDAFQNMVRKTSLEEPDKMLQLKNQFDIPEEFVASAGHLDPEVQQLVLHPTEGMVSAHQAWAADVADYQAEAKHLTPEVVQQHLDNQDALLQEHMTTPPVVEGPRGAVPFKDAPPPDYPIKPTYVPMEEAAGFQLHHPGIAAKVVPDRLHERFGITPEERFRRGKTDRPTNIGGIKAESLFVPSRPRSEHTSSGTTFASGAFRRDARLYLDHIVARHRDAIENGFKSEQVNRWAKKDPDGNLLYVSGGSKGQAEVDAMIPGHQAVAVPPDFPIAWFHNEIDHMEKVNQAIDKWLENHPNADEHNIFTDSDLENFINTITEEDAKAFVATHWGAFKRKQVVMPRDVFDYQLRLAKLDEPFNTATARFLTRMMHRWRTAVLTLMPRWGVNTAIGSFVLNTLRGVNFNDYWIANRLNKAGLMPAGVNLGHQAVQEVMESAAPGYGQKEIATYMSDVGIRVPTRAMLQGVQNIENYFRRAQFVHNLKREQRLERDASGRVVDVGLDGTDEALDGVSKMLQQHYGEVPPQMRKIPDAMDSPVLQQRALDETNKFAYNYQILGPAERRIVRQFVPFWGWYKFITMAAYRMAVEMPGRANLLSTIGQIAQEDEDKLGPMPEWVKGSIPLKLAGGKLSYLSTMGANPFSTVANPLRPGATAQGLIGLGQLNPAIQSGLSAFGFDTLTGDRVRISPQEGVGQDFLGRLYQGNRQVAPGNVAPGRRFFMGLLRSLPEYRLAEQASFGTQYPEGVPFIPGLARPMGSPPTGTENAALGTTGLAPKSYDLATYQQLLVKATESARKRNLADRRRLMRKTK